MNTMLKTLAVVGALTMSGAALSQAALADDDDARAPAAYGVNCPGYGPGMHGGRGMRDGYGPGPGMGMGYGMRGGPGWGLMGGRFDAKRELTADQVRILAQAHLIRLGNDNLKVGKVTETKDKSYEVQIVTKDNSLVNVVEISRATGMPVR